MHIVNTLRGKKLNDGAVAVRVLIVDVLDKFALSATSRRCNHVQSEGSVLYKVVPAPRASSVVVVVHSAHNQKNYEDRDQEDADKDEEEQDDAADESQSGSSRNGNDSLMKVMVSIYRELKAASKAAHTRHKVINAPLTALVERTSSSAPSSAMGSPLVIFTSFQLL